MTPKPSKSKAPPLADDEISMFDFFMQVDYEAMDPKERTALGRQLAMLLAFVEREPIYVDKLVALFAKVSGGQLCS